MKIICWFSAGVSSAVALLLHKVDLAIYIDIDDQHADSFRFCREVCAKADTKLLTLRSPYGSVENVCRSFRYVNGPAGAKCTTVLKKAVRKVWESDNRGTLTYVWGMDSSESARIARLVDLMPEVDHIFPLAEKGIAKQTAHAMLKQKSIKRPVMYNLGYNNNNCIGCVKGKMGYWNKIRQDFPDIFKRRAAMERSIGRSCINGTFLDELNPSAGRLQTEISEECGIACEMALENE